MHSFGMNFPKWQAARLSKQGRELGSAFNAAVYALIAEPKSAFL
jgi:hypothetical protein